MAPGKVTVFGGTGFLGQRVVQRLLERDLSVRVAVRHPERIVALFPALHLDAIQADVNDDRSVAAAVAGVEGVVNAVSLYAESGSQTFHSVHVEAATRVARLAREAGVGRFIHVSGIGADAESASPYIRSRGKGEKAVREAFPATTLIRPSIMFGRGDAFLIPIAGMLRRLPVFPLFGRGQTQLQPAYVEDVADAIARVMQNAQSLVCYELGGPRVYAYRWPGRDLKAFVEQGHNAIGLEGAEHFVTMARAHSGCEVWRQDFLKLALPEKHFDGVFANAALFHVPRQELPRVLLELHATLKPGGVLFSSNPRGDNEEGWNSGRYSVFHDLESWRRYAVSGGIR
jgi:uncharacterized protein YbjT (DUF2867 family)